MAQYTSSSAEHFYAETKTIGWMWHLFVFSVVVFACTLLLYLGMVFGYEPFLNAQIDNLNQQINEEVAKIDVGNQSALVNFYSQIYNIQGLLKSHVVPSGLFTFLESSVTEGVYYTGAEFDDKAHTLKLNGEAATYDVLVRQLESYARRPEIARALLSGSELEDGRVTKFDMLLTLSPQFLKGQ